MSKNRQACLESKLGWGPATSGWQALGQAIELWLCFQALFSFWSTLPRRSRSQETPMNRALCQGPLRNMCPVVPRGYFHVILIHVIILIISDLCFETVASCCELLWLSLFVTVSSVSVACARPERSQVRFCQNCGGKVRMVRVVRMVRPCRGSNVSKPFQTYQNVSERRSDLWRSKHVQNMSKTWCKQRNTQFARVKLWWVM